MTTNLPRGVWLLSLANAYLLVGNSLLITVSALIGFELADDKRLATLPVALQFFTIMCTTIPASLAMGRFGRKAVFMVGALIGMTGSGFALLALFWRQFEIFCLASMCFGMVAAIGNYYRFAAADLVTAGLRPRAISLVMLGGVLAAFVGPNLANWSSGLFSTQALAGPFAALIGVLCLSLLTVSMIDFPTPPARDQRKQGRPLKVIIAQPLFIIAVICQMFGYGIMNLVMTSTPLAMASHDMGLGATALVIQWHVVAMSAPSFFTGRLIERFGYAGILGTGVALGVLAVMINLIGTSLPHFLTSLIALGISWNFLFVGGTTLLTECHRPEERARTQALNDFLVFSTVSITALSAGTLHYLYGWRMVNLGVTPLLGITALAILWLVLHQRVTQAELSR